MSKTVVVEIGRTYLHPLYKKVVHSRRKVMAHDELGCQMGDQVQIVESQPISHKKRWVVEAIIRQTQAAGVSPDLVSSELEIAAKEAQP